MILLAITPGLGFQPQAWQRVLRSGIHGFLIREKSMPARHLLETARWCQDVAPDVRLWVAGRLDVALVAGCGLHAPEAHPDLPPGLVPLSRPLHAEDQWPGRASADQLLISPIFASPGKGAPWGPERLHRFLDGLPAGGPQLLALGGVEPGSAMTMRHPRLAGIAAIRPFWGEDPAGAVARFLA
ncbi:thiamine phosphate synthase [Geothrix sp. PMB-07]|uniref:thiamine phosphate synthase n=1 Tax=Geothrix sp. PMB-07 TaxID=3068640 RepID=UPI002740F60D|nr:thiamine phosphate synthase [Geothrix sp. PMB-07]WLT31399.1 thiamine phosphate synthase [Geothrix sp. PMB-07]